MANYTQSVLFAPKDGYTTGDPGKVVKGTEIDAELGAIVTAIASKENSASKGAASGYAPLDASTFVPVANLPVVTAAKGGTGRSTLTAGNVLAGNGTGTVNLLAPGTAGQVLRSTGTAFASAALIAADIPALDAGKITTGAFADARIPSLAASKITSGVFGIARIPTGTTGTTVALGNHTQAISTIVGLQTALDGKSATSHTHSYLPLSGGTMTGNITRSGQGVHLYHKSSSHSSGGITVSAAAPSGGANGDLWLVV